MQASLASRYGKSDPIKAVKKENADLKRLIGDLTIANDALKKPWRQTEIECSQDDTYTVESAQVAGVYGRFKKAVVLQLKTKGDGIGSCGDGCRTPDKREAPHI